MRLLFRAVTWIDPIRHSDCRSTIDLTVCNFFSSRVHDRIRCGVSALLVSLLFQSEILFENPFSFSDQETRQGRRASSAGCHGNGSAVIGKHQFRVKAATK